MESIGVKLKLEDYKRMFESIDYNNEGEIDFTKFCYLNTDKKVDLKEMKNKAQSSLTSGSHHSSKKPPLGRLSVAGSAS